MSDLQEYMESASTEALRERASKQLARELDYAQHLGVMSAIVNLHPGEYLNFARLLQSKTCAGSGSLSSLNVRCFVFKDLLIRTDRIRLINTAKQTYRYRYKSDQLASISFTI